MKGDDTGALQNNRGFSKREMLSIRREKITDFYTFDKQLGFGAFGEVSLGTNRST